MLLASTALAIGGTLPYGSALRAVSLASGASAKGAAESQLAGWR